MFQQRFVMLILGCAVLCSWQNATSASQPALSSSRTFLIRNAALLTATGKNIRRGQLLLVNGKIRAIGVTVKAPKHATEIDAKGHYVTPGLIDTHSHIGVYAAPHVRATADGNEGTRPVTAYAWSEWGFWPRDPAILRAVEGGTTTAQILPGSANLIGGRSVILKLRRARSVQHMKFAGAPQGLKMACGENPKRYHRGIRSRMGNVAGYRRAFQKAVEYRRVWRHYHKAHKKWQFAKKNKPSSRPANSRPVSRPVKSMLKSKAKPAPRKPRKDHNLETLMRVLDGKILVHIHCYRADEMLQMIALSKEFGFKIRSFHHAVEAYKIRDVLAKEKISSSVWADWWGFKLEAYDGIQENAPMLTHAGARAIIHSDSSIGIQRLNQEAAKAFFRGKAMGLPLTRTQALRWITVNPAWALGIDKYVGTLEVGKHADVVIWDRDPFSVYAKTTHVFMDGRLVYKRGGPKRLSDFELGQGPIQPATPPQRRGSR